MAERYRWCRAGGAAAAVLFRRLALIELAVLVVMWFHEGPENECVLSVNSGAGAICPLRHCCRYLLLAWRARSTQSPWAGRVAGTLARHYPNCSVARYLRPLIPAGFSPDAVCDGRRDADYRHRACGCHRWISVAATG